MDDGLLIEQVSTFPQLYAKTDGRYKNNRLKENAWLTISQILDETPQACEHRWKLLRNKYMGLRREIKNKPSGSGASQITWPYFRMMGFLDKYLQTRRSYSNIEIDNRSESTEWNSVSQIVVEHDQQNEGIAEDLHQILSESENPENEYPETDSQSGVSSFTEKSDDIKSCGSKTIVTQPKKTPIKRPIWKRDKENEIPRRSIPTKKIKTSEVLTEKISGCFETFNKVLEKNMTEHQPTPNEDEYFVRSLAADMSMFSAKDKIILKKKIYQVISNHSEFVEDDSI